MIFEDVGSTLPKRKSTHLQHFDYASKGAYFVTICTQDRKQLLSKVFLPSSQIYHQSKCQPVGEGLAPPDSFPPFVPDNAVAKVRLKPCGQIAKEQLILLEKRYPSVSLLDYVIMPDHIHAIIFLNNDAIDRNNLSNAGGASPSPTLNDVICSFKSLTARACKQKYGIEKLFQRSYAEHIIRDYKDYETRKAYIQQNPVRWYCKQLSQQDR